MAVATALMVTPAQATSASSSMSAEHARLPSPPVAGCRPAVVSPSRTPRGRRHDPDRAPPRRGPAYARFPLAHDTALSAAPAARAVHSRPSCRDPVASLIIADGVRSATRGSKEHLMPRQTRLNAFDMNCVSHISRRGCGHPRDHADRYNTLDYWIDLARVLEHGKFDALFLADVLGVYDEGQPVRSRGRHPGRSSIANATNGPLPARRQMSRPLRRRWRCASTRPRGA